MNTQQQITWAQLDKTLTWQDVDFIDVPKHKLAWQSELIDLASDTALKELESTISGDD